MAKQGKPEGKSPSFPATEEPESRGWRMRHSPSAARNEADIRAVLAPRLPAQGSALEIASGTGLHAAGLDQFNNVIEFDQEFWRHEALEIYVDVPAKEESAPVK